MVVVLVMRGTFKTQVGMAFNPFRVPTLYVAPLPRINGLCGPLPAIEPPALVYNWEFPAVGSGPPMINSAGPPPPPFLQISQSVREPGPIVFTTQVLDCWSTVGAPLLPMSKEFSVAELIVELGVPALRL